MWFKTSHSFSTQFFRGKFNHSSLQDTLFFKGFRKAFGNHVCGVISGGAPLDPEVSQFFRAAFNGPVSTFLFSVVIDLTCRTNVGLCVTLINVVRSLCLVWFIFHDYRFLRTNSRGSFRSIGPRRIRVYRDCWRFIYDTLRRSRNADCGFRDSQHRSEIGWCPWYGSRCSSG